MAHDYTREKSPALESAKPLYLLVKRVSLNKYSTHNALNFNTKKNETNSPYNYNIFLP